MDGSLNEESPCEFWGREFPEEGQQEQGSKQRTSLGELAENGKMAARAQAGEQSEV